MKKTLMLKKNYEFKNVLAKGKYFSGDFIEAFIKKNGNSDCNCIGIAISVKAGNAVQRNHIKRLIREKYKTVENSIKCGFNIVFLWKKKKDVEEANYSNVSRDLDFIFQKAKIFNEE